MTTADPNIDSQPRSFALRKALPLLFAVCAGLGCLYSIYALIQQSQLPVSPPSALGATPVVHQLGEIGEQENQATYSLVNNSNERIRIASVEKTCSCTELSVSAKELVPGATATVNMVWSTRGLRGPSNTNFNVYYSMGESPGLQILSLGIEGEVVPDVSYVPDDILFSLGSDVQNLDVLFMPKSGSPPLAVMNAISGCPAISIEILGSDFIRASFDPKNLRGSQRSFTIQVVFNESRLVTIPVRIKES